MHRQRRARTAGRDGTGGLAAAVVVGLAALPLLAQAFAAEALSAEVQPLSEPAARPCLIIAHRGASALVPEHTLEAYAIAARLGADYIEPDLVMTRDGALIARHDNVLNLTTDVASHPEFAARRTTRSVDGEVVEGWFSEDFTLAEIKTLRSIERIPELRPRNTMFDGRFAIPTFDEILDLAKMLSEESGRTIGVYPETKHPTHFAAAGLPMEKPLLESLQRHGMETAGAPVFIQSFEIGNLKALATMTDLPLIQLLWKEGAPFDIQNAGGTTSYDQMATADGLKAIAEYAAGVGPEKNHFIIPLDADGRLDLAHAGDFVAQAHAAGLVVHPYTFRAENHFLPAQYREGARATALGHLDGEISAFLATGIDGFFTDSADAGARACRAFGSRND